MTEVQRRGALWNHDLSWLLNGAESAMGFRGNTGSVISMIEAGGPNRGDGDHEHVTDTQLGWGRSLVSAPARWRPLWARWRRLSPDPHQLILAAHYAAERLPPGIESAFRVSEDHGEGSPVWHVCVGAVALLLVGPTHAVKVLVAAAVLDEKPQSWALTEQGRQAVAVLRGPRERAERAVREAHSAWADTDPDAPVKPVSTAEARQQRVEEFVWREIDGL